MGNDDQTGRFAQIIASLEIENNVRGFATNVANYQPLGQSICPTPGICKGGDSNHPCCADDPCNLQNDWNWAHNELNYVDVLDMRMRSAMPGFTRSSSLTQAGMGAQMHDQIVEIGAMLVVVALAR